MYRITCGLIVNPKTYYLNVRFQHFVFKMS